MKFIHENNFKTYIMKKLIYLFLTVLIVACSSEDNNENNNNDDNNEPNLLVSSINYTYYENTDEEITELDTFTYDGNKIIEKILSYYSNGNLTFLYRYEYIYANNKISRVDQYDLDNNIRFQTNFTYDSQGRTVSIEECFQPNNSVCDDITTFNYFYNDDGSITVTGSSAGTVTYQLDDNGNIISRTSDDGFREIIYDNQKNPFQNITGVSNSFIRLSNARLTSINNNPLSFVEEYDDEYQGTGNWTYDYNDAGYPRNVVYNESSLGGYQYSSTIVIEYFE
tara:strand:- start:71 stop:913 length:843 start_codon:yes stop_codon:yes gene_type:complete